MPVPPYDIPVNLTGQWVMTVLVVIALLIAAYSAIRMSRRLATWGPVVTLAGSVFAGFIEPMYCAATHLWYYRPGQWNLYTAMGNSQPVWSWLSYGAFYGGLTLLIWWRVERGASRTSIMRLWGILLLIGIATEIVCIQLGTYEYYGPHPFRVAQFPLWIAVANATIGVVAGIFAARLRPSLPGYQSLAFFALVPACMTMVQFGTGFLAIDVINSSDPSTFMLYFSAIVSMGLAVTIALVAMKLLPATPRADSEDEARAGAKAGAA